VQPARDAGIPYQGVRGGKGRGAKPARAKRSGRRDRRGEARGFAIRAAASRRAPAATGREPSVGA